MEYIYNYFDLLPSELITQILYYLDISDIWDLKTSGVNSIQFNQVLNNKYFWINKSRYDGLEPEFLEYFNLIERNNISSKNYRIKRGDYLSSYDKVFNLMMDIGPIIKGIKDYSGSSIILHLSEDGNFKDLISTYDLQFFNSMINIYGTITYIIRMDGNTFHYNCYYESNNCYYESNNPPIEKGTISYKDIVFLLIKLELLGYDIFGDFTNLTERVSSSDYSPLFEFSNKR